MNCPKCGGRKLGSEDVAVTVEGLTFAEALRLPIMELLRFMQHLAAELSENERNTTAAAIYKIFLRKSKEDNSSSCISSCIGSCLF